MENEEKNQEVELEEENNEEEEVEETEDEEESEEETTDEDEEDDEVATLREENEKLKKQQGILKRNLTKISKDKKPEDLKLSSKDLYALMEAKIPQEDLEEVVKASKILNKSIPEALKDDTLKTVLEKRAEHRKTADAMNTKSKKAGNKKLSDDALLENAKKGIFPEKGSEDAERLYWARRGGVRE